ncbi:hypothetical protein NFI96_031293, partial [Prochilodus magdalenae]
MKPRTCTFPERVSVISSRHYVAVEYKNLRLQDAGLYQCGDAGVWNHTLNLTVTQDPCCSGPKTVTGYLGETVTISCSYPDQYKENVKNLQKQYGQYFTEVIDTEKTQKERFSISEDRRSKAVSVRISDVKEDDGGVYYCGVWLGGGAVIYFSLYSEIQLQVTDDIVPGVDGIFQQDNVIPVADGICLQGHVFPGVDGIFQEDNVTLWADGIFLQDHVFPVVDGIFQQDNVILWADRILQEDSIFPWDGIFLQGHVFPGVDGIFQQDNIFPEVDGIFLQQNIFPWADGIFQVELGCSRQVSPVASSSDDPGVYANASDQHMYSTIQPPKDQDPTYTTVSFQKNQASTMDTSVSRQYKIQLVLIQNFFLSVDPVGCYDVTGYPGGNIIMYVAHNQYGQPENYFCKETSNERTYIKSKQTQNMWKHKGRLSLYDSSEGLIVIYRNLSLQDTGLYQCGATGVWNRTVNLEVNTGDQIFYKYDTCAKIVYTFLNDTRSSRCSYWLFKVNYSISLTDPCCLGPKILTGYLGETVNISCSYPKKFKKNIKLFYKADGLDFSEVIRTTDSKKERVSISEDGRSRVVSVRIRDVREDDGGVYFCGVGTVEESVSFNSLYSELHLQVTGEPQFTALSIPIIHLSSIRQLHPEGGTSLIIIVVCVSVALLLIGGSGLIFYRLRCTKTQGPVGCYEVTGYSGGAVEIYCMKQSPKRFDKFCKDGGKQCVYLKPAQTQDTWDHNDRVYLHEDLLALRIIFRALSVQDTGSYQCGDAGFGKQDIELEVKTDPCCSGPKTETGYLGKTVTINCPYPEGFGEKKFFEKLDGHIFTEVIRTGSTPDHSIGGGVRFSISDNRESRVVSMTITDVREDDAGVYVCGAMKEDSLKYETFFSEIQLQVTGSPTPDSPIKTAGYVCLALLLIGGLALIVYVVIHKRRPGSSSPSSKMEVKDTELPSVVTKQTGRASAPDTGVEAGSSDKEIDSSKQAPKDDGPTYTTVNFLKVPGSPGDKVVSLETEDSATDMKLLLTLYLISGSVSCFDVIGYSGGSIIVNCNYDQQYGRSRRYFCRNPLKRCVYLDQLEKMRDRKGRISLYDNTGVLTVVYRNLCLQDAGVYHCGETGVWKHTVNLTVNEDPCCSRPKTVAGYLGEACTIRCSYPEKIIENIKTFHKQDGLMLPVMIHTVLTQRNRFSISDNRRSRVLSVRIRDVREEDGGVYYCGLWNGEDYYSYYSLYTEIQLQVTDSAFTSTRPGANETVEYENDPPGKRNNVSTVYQNLNPNPNRSDSVYQSLDPGSRGLNSQKPSPLCDVLECNVEMGSLVEVTVSLNHSVYTELLWLIVLQRNTTFLSLYSKMTVLAFTGLDWPTKSPDLNPPESLWGTTWSNHDAAGRTLGNSYSYQRTRNQPNQREEERETHRENRTLQRKWRLTLRRTEETVKNSRRHWTGVCGNISEAGVQFRMKVLLLLFLFCLISGLVSCFDVIGYSGGTLMIYCTYKQHGLNTTYFCETSKKQCVYLDQVQKANGFNGRAYLDGRPGAHFVVYRKLSLQDAGSYQCGETGVWSQDLNLTVIKDPCCSGPKTVAGNLGETVTISCSYPEGFNKYSKTFRKQEGRTFTTVSLNSRFSIFDDRGSRVLSVRIRDVREGDGGVYYCGVWIGGGAVGYHILYTEIQLQVTGKIHWFLHHHHHHCVYLCGSAADWRISSDVLQTEMQENTRSVPLLKETDCTGPVSCFDVIGYSGGTVMINCKDKLYGWNTKYFCETSTKQCVYLDQLQRTNDYDGRTYLYGPPGARVVVYRNLSLQDAGLYRCGETRLWGHDLKLTVIKDSCCSGSKTVSGYLGETVTISCPYPEEFKINIKTFHKQGGQYFTELIDTTMTHRGRFSISEDRGSRVLSVRIRDVREDDKGEYYCGVWKAEESISYYSLHTEIQLQVTALPAPTPTTPGEDHS